MPWHAVLDLAADHGHQHTEVRVFGSTVSGLCDSTMRSASFPELRLPTLA